MWFVEVESYVLEALFHQKNTCTNFFIVQGDCYSISTRYYWHSCGKRIAAASLKCISSFQWSEAMSLYNVHVWLYFIRCLNSLYLFFNMKIFVSYSFFSENWSFGKNFSLIWYLENVAIKMNFILLFGLYWAFECVSNALFTFTIVSINFV